MLRYAIIFFVIAIIAAFFGFGGIASGAESLARICFYVFLIIAAVTLVMNFFGKGRAI